MLSKIDKKVRSMVANHSQEADLPSDIESNPLASYVKIFQNQHKVILVLYKGLIIAFSGFVILLSLLVINTLNNDLVPIWGAVSLGIIDLFLLLGIIKAFQELNRYKRKSTSITQQIYEYLKNDLTKIERIKTEHSFISHTHKKIQHKIRSLTEEVKHKKVEGYQGWDKQICPSCKASIEMLTEVCPHCRHKLGKPYEN